MADGRWQMANELTTNDEQRTTDKTMTTQAQLTELAAAYSAAHAATRSLACAIQEAMDTMIETQRPGLERAVETETETHRALLGAVQDAPAEFERPRSVEYAGVKYGFAKLRGTLEWTDDEKVVAKIKKLFGEKEARQYIRVTEVPDRKALNKLRLQQLREIGVTVEDDSDVAFARPVDGDVSKLVKRFLAAGKEGEDAK